MSRSKIRSCSVAFALLGLAFFAGCQQVPVHQQRLVSSPAMQFSGSALLASAPRAAAQLEPGTSVNAGGAASGCTTCR